MELQTRYITADEFLQYTGINLREELNDTSNGSDKVNAFLKRTEDRMEAFLNAKFFKNVSDLYPEFSEFQKKHYKLALLEQAYYVFKNGDISSDSGYNQETLEIANQKKLRALAVAPNAIDHLRLTGLWSGFIGGKGLFGPYLN
jgi:hypothetical protein